MLASCLLGKLLEAVELPRLLRSMFGEAASLDGTVKLSSS
jgi:hypothetical protein